MTRSVASVLVTGFRRQRLNHDTAAPPLGSNRSNLVEGSCSHAQHQTTNSTLARRASGLAKWKQGRALSAQKSYRDTKGSEACFAPRSSYLAPILFLAVSSF